MGRGAAEVSSVVRHDSVVFVTALCGETRAYIGIQKALICWRCADEE
jgi:hypothetical protein